MGILDAPARKAASSVIGRLGKKMVLKTVSQRRYDPVTRKSKGGMKREREITAVVGQVSSTDLRSGLHGAREGDLRLEIAAQGLEEAPTTDHAVVFEGQDFQIVAVDPVYASDQVATYVVAARR